MGKTSLFHLYLGRFRKFYFTHRIIPSMSQCMEVIGVNSKSVVHRFFQQMIDDGYLEKKQGIYYPGDKLVSLPLFDSVRAGGPAAATQTQTELIGLDSYMIRDPQHTILLTVAGESMIDAGLYEGDLLVVDTDKKAKIGDIVIAIVDTEYTVKYLQKDEKEILFLQPANDAFDPIYPDEALQIYGVVISSCRVY